MSRGIQLRVNRAEAIRIVGAAMREKTQEWEREKKAYPRKFAAAKKLAVGKIKSYLRQIERTNDPTKVRKLIDACDLDWKCKEGLSHSPTLNICELKGFLVMLQSDVRKVVPINSNHDLWGILQGKCEPIS